MKYCILMGSPRKTGNTISITEPFMKELKVQGNEVELIWLYDKTIHSCKACRVCQLDWNVFGCQHQDDVYPIFDSVLNSDVIIFATPIYSWCISSSVFPKNRKVKFPTLGMGYSKISAGDIFI